MKQIIKNFQSQVEIFEEKLKSFSERERKNRVLDDIIESDYSLRDFEEQFEYIKRISKNLLKNHKWFFTVVSRNDIINLEGNFNHLNYSLQNGEYHSVIHYLNAIKEIIWKYNVTILSKHEYISDFYEELIKLQGTYRDWQLKLQEIDKDLEIKNWIIENIDDLKEKYDELESKIQDINHNHSDSSELLNEIKEHKEKFNSFVEKIDDREKIISSQHEKINNDNNEIEKLNEKYNEKLEESKELIESAKQALSYKTAEWISAAIQSQYDSANKWYNTIWWIILSIIFLIWTFAFAYCTYNTEIKSIYQFLSRFSFIMLWVSVSIFSASRYVKQKNIIEDYAYKLVLAKSIIWFSEELKKWWEEWYQKYITKTLEELLQDPLREKGSKNAKIDMNWLKDWIWFIKELKDLIK